MLICDFFNHPIKLNGTWDLGIPRILGNLTTTLGVSVISCYCGKTASSRDCYYIKQDITYPINLS